MGSSDRLTDRLIGDADIQSARRATHPSRRTSKAANATTDPRLGLLVDTVVDQAAFVVDADRRIVTWNGAAQRLTGYQPAEVVGQDVAILFAGDRTAADNAQQPVGADRSTYRHESDVRWTRKDGSVAPVRLVTAPLRDPSGAVVGYGLVAREISGQRPADRPIAESDDPVESDHSFRLLVGSVLDYAIFMLDPDGTVVTWNEGAHRLKQYETHEIVGRNFSVFYAPEDRAAGKPQRLLDEAVRHQRCEDEGWRLRKDGSRFWADVVITALRAPNGDLQGFAKVTRDLTERRAADAALRQNEERLTRIVEGAIDHAMFILDPQGVVETWNEGARRLTGYEDADVIGRGFSIFYTDEDRTSGTPQRHLDEVRRTGRREDDGWRVRKDGAAFWANVVLSAVSDDRGVPCGFCAVVRDLTERREADELLRQSEERFRLMVESVADYAIFMLDPEGMVVTWNEGARRLKLYNADEIVGRHFSAFYPLEDRAAGKPHRLLAEAIRTGRVEDEGWRIRKDGSRFWGDVVITALRTGDGQLHGFAKVTRDLTERMQGEQALREIAAHERDAATRLRVADEARQHLIAMVAHDLRAPVGALRGTAEMLVTDWDRMDDVGRLQLLHMILSTGSRLSGLIDDVLDFARIEAGRLHIEVDDVDLFATVMSAAADVDPTQQRITVIRRARSTVVRGDQRRIWQIAANLLSNAIKFSSSPSDHVEVVIDNSDGMARVSVTDHGLGIAEEDHERLFQPFSRVGAGRGAAGAVGTGLGLYIARSLVTAQGGQIGVTSEVGSGSTFHFTLPLST